MDEWLCHPLLVERDSGPDQLLPGVGQCGTEMAQQPLDRMCRNLPDAEESQDMVDTVSSKIVGHLTEPALPPGKTILLHRLPIVGRKSPVLSGRGKIIRRCTCLGIHVKEVSCRPCLNAVTVYPDGDVPLEHYPLAICILPRFAQLFIEQILYETGKVDAP